MSFLWHGLTEQGAQVPVQVDAQGRVIAVDGTPGTNYWDRVDGKLSPANAGDSVDIGSGNITLNASGSSSFVGDVNFSNLNADGTASLAAGKVEFAPSGRTDIYRASTTSTAAILQLYSDVGGTKKRHFAFNVDGTLRMTDENIVLNADGTATFIGNITAPNVTFRSADPQFYVKKSKNKDASPEYVGPELDLLAEIARLEALVRHLYETLRLAPPAGWPVWDGNDDDVLRQLRK